MVVRRSAIKSKRSKERRGHRLKTKIIFCFIIIIFVLGGISWITHNERILINDIQIEGIETIEVKEIMGLAEEHLSGKYFWLFPKKNTFIFPKEEVEINLLDKYKQIKNVAIKRDGLNTLKITILEREPFALWCDSEMIVEEKKEEIGNCYFVDYEGYIYATAPYFFDNIYFELYGEPFFDNDENLEKIEEKREDLDNTKEESSIGDFNKKEYIGRHFLPPEEFVRTMQFVSSLEKIELPVHSLIIDSSDMYKLTLVGGGILRFLPALDYHRSINDLTTAYKKKFSEDSDLLPEDLEYIDIRFENKILFKFKD